MVVWASFFSDGARVEAAPFIYDDTQWPTVGKTISSPFGPRKKASDNFRYDFHRGIDIPGDSGEPIVAMADGEVYRTYFENDPGSSFPNGGNVAILRHSFDQPYPFHGMTFTTYYSLYLHLDEILVDTATPGGPYDPVTKGAVIGTLGQTGGTVFDHLHFEIRIGTTCSREFQLANPQSSCASTFGQTPQDPHVNPMQFVEYPDTNATQIEVLQNTPLTVRVSAPRSELDFNEIRVDHVGGPTVVNLNSRTGIDPNDIDNPDHDGILITPGEFRSESATYEITFEFSAIDDHTSIQVIDVHGNVTMFGVPSVPAVSVWGILVMAAFVVGMRKVAVHRGHRLRGT